MVVMYRSPVRIAEPRATKVAPSLLSTVCYCAPSTRSWAVLAVGLPRQAAMKRCIGIRSGTMCPLPMTASDRLIYGSIIIISFFPLGSPDSVPRTQSSSGLCYSPLIA